MCWGRGGRRGKKKAIIAVGHKILTAAYFMIDQKMAFKELGEAYLSSFQKEHLIAYYKKQLRKLDPEFAGLQGAS